MSNSKELLITYEYSSKPDRAIKQWTVSGHQDVDTWESMTAHWKKYKPAGAILLRIILERR